MIIPLQFGLGLVLSVLIALLAQRRGALAPSGAVGAVVIGTGIFGFGGWVWGLLLIAFFMLSSLLSRYRAAEKAHVAADKFEKGHARDLGQALANGGAGVLIAAAYALWRSDAHLLAAFVGAMASVNADTWATELGVLSRRPPRLITTLAPVEAGTSGGISWVGTLAALGGALTIGASALALLALDGLGGGRGFAAAGGLPRALGLMAAALVGGLGGALFDSLLGATVQAIYFCPACGKETEKRLHTCGTATLRRRGWRWLNNDMVNFLSSLVGALAACGIWALMG